MAAVHEIIRQKKRNLNLAAGTRTYDFNLLLDAGCVKNIDCGYITGMEVFGIPYVTRKRAERMIASGQMGSSTVRPKRSDAPSPVKSWSWSLPFMRMSVSFMSTDAISMEIPRLKVP
jgi:hypothetical protein